jgi:TRAP transporter TAXI family solute receptor
VRHILHALSGAVFLVSAGASADTLSFGTTEGGGPVFAAMTAISKAAVAHEGMDVRIQPFRGTAQYVPIINAGELAGGLANAMQLVEAYKGVGTFDGKSHPNLRLIAASYPFKLTMGVRAESGIESITQIKGLRMASEYHSSPIGDTLSDALLANAGLSRDDMKLVPVASFGEARKLMGQGLIDMWLAVVGSGSTAGVEQKVGKVRLVTLDDSPAGTAGLQKVVPIAEIATVEPRPGFLGVDKPIKVMKYDYMLFTSGALADDDAYKLAKTLHENKAELAAAVPAFKGFDPQQMSPDLGVPYHPGAIRFYKEVGIWRNAD